MKEASKYSVKIIPSHSVVVCTYVRMFVSKSIYTAAVDEWNIIAEKV